MDDDQFTVDCNDPKARRTRSSQETQADSCCPDLHATGGAKILVAKKLLNKLRDTGMFKLYMNENVKQATWNKVHKLFQPKISKGVFMKKLKSKHSKHQQKQQAIKKKNATSGASGKRKATGPKNKKGRG